MNVFDRIATWVGAKAKLEKNENALLDQANDVRSVLEALSNLLSNPDVLKAFVSGLDVASPHQKARYLSGAAYHAYLSRAPMKVEQMEHRHPMSSILALLATGITDINALLRRPELLTDAEADGEEATRFSQLVTSGYIQALSDFAEWVYYLLRLSDEYRADGSRANADNKIAPNYVRHKLEDLLPRVVALAEEVFRRPGRGDFVALLDKMVHSGRDLRLQSDGHTIADYANERSYDKAELNYGELGILNPFSMWGTAAILRRRAYYQRNKAIRDWLATKAARFTLDAAQADPSSPEYARLTKIGQNYADLVAQYDKELEKHAHQH